MKQRDRALLGLSLVALMGGAACGSDDTANDSDDSAFTGGNTASAGGSPNSGSGSGGATGGQPVALACDAFEAGNNLNVCSQTYLSGSTDDGPGSVGLSPDGTVVYGGNLGDAAFGVEPVDLGDGSGGVVRLSADGRTALSVTRVGGNVSELAVDAASGSIAVVGDFGLKMLKPDASEQTFHAQVGALLHVAVDDVVAAFGDNRVVIFSSAGEALGDFMLDGSQVMDLAVDAANEQVVVTGFKQDDGAPCTQLQIPYVRSFDFDGTPKWHNYDWNRTEIGGVDECADTRGISIALGRDGKLYYAGESHGGNTIHRRDPKDFNVPTDKLTKYDAYNDPYNLNGAAPILFFARLDPATGNLEGGQFGVVRLPPDKGDKGNAMRPRNIAADEDGNILVGGVSACCIEGAEAKTINGEHAAFGEYLGGAFLLVVPADFSSRLVWTSVVGAQGGGAEVVSVAARRGQMAAALRQAFDDQATTEAPLLTIDAIQSEPGGGLSDGFVTVFRGPVN